VVGGEESKQEFSYPVEFLSDVLGRHGSDLLSADLFDIDERANFNPSAGSGR
jgi:hypothetical protein